MRTSAWIAFGLLLFIVACRAAPTATEPMSNATAKPVEVTFALPDKLADRLALGLPMTIELRTQFPITAVGTCGLAFDLWDETYRVALSKTHVVHAKQPTEALKHCVDQPKVQAVARAAGRNFSPMLTVKEIEARPLYSVRPYDEF